MFGSFDEMNLLDIEVPLVERAGLAAAVRGDWLMAPALARGTTDYFGDRLKVVEPEGNSSEQVSFLFIRICTPKVASSTLNGSPRLRTPLLAFMG